MRKAESDNPRIRKYYELFLKCKPLLSYMKENFDADDILFISANKIKVFKGEIDLSIENCGLKN